MKQQIFHRPHNAQERLTNTGLVAIPHKIVITEDGKHMPVFLLPSSETTMGSYLQAGGWAVEYTHDQAVSTTLSTPPAPVSTPSKVPARTYANLQSLVSVLYQYKLNTTKYDVEKTEDGRYYPVFKVTTMNKFDRLSAKGWKVKFTGFTKKAVETAEVSPQLDLPLETIVAPSTSKFKSVTTPRSYNRKSNVDTVIRATEFHNLPYTIEERDGRFTPVFTVDDQSMFDKLSAGGWAVQMAVPEYTTESNVPVLEMSIEDIEEDITPVVLETPKKDKIQRLHDGTFARIDNVRRALKRGNVMQYNHIITQTNGRYQAEFIVDNLTDAEKLFNDGWNVKLRGNGFLVKFKGMKA